KGRPTLRPGGLFSICPSFERKWVFLAVDVIRIAKRDLGLSMKKPFNDFQPLHERMILIADFVFPGAESAARINFVSFQRGQNLRERFVSMQTRRRVSVSSPISPGRD